MRFWTYRPGPPLADFVELFWYYEQYAPGHKKESILPMATMELVVQLDETSRPVVSGPHSRPFVLDTAQPATMVGVHFKPGGAFAVLDISVAEIHNSQANLEEMWGRKANELKARIFECRTPQAIFRFVEQTLLQTGVRHLKRHPAVEFALNEFAAVSPMPTVAEVNDRVGLTPRRFIKLFTEQVGLRPKLYCRIERFQRTLRSLEKTTRLNWAEVALSNGYYDQAHFVNEFRSLAGLTPMAYMRLRNDHFNHVPLVD
jgi:AraC-like DNA-binding protein